MQREPAATGKSEALGGDRKLLSALYTEPAAAVQQTATRLADEHPEGGCRRTKAWLLPYGLSPGSDTNSDTARIGALDLLNTDCVSAQRCDGGYVSPQDDVETLTASVPHGSLDVAIMNPPYARPIGHEGARRGIVNPAFAALGQDEKSQRAMGRALDQQVKLLKAAARREARDSGLPPVPFAWNGNAGLATALLTSCPTGVAVRARDGPFCGATTAASRPRCGSCPAHMARFDQDNGPKPWPRHCGTGRPVSAVPRGCTSASILGPLETVRQQWCSESSVHGGKQTRPV